MTPVRATALHLEQMGVHLDRMIAIQATAYPDHWPDADRRELAEKHLFGLRQSDTPNVEKVDAH